MRRGFTLIEVVTVIVVISIIGAFSFGFFIYSIETYNIMKTQQELYSDGAYIMEKISREFREGTGFTFLIWFNSYFQKASRFISDNTVDRNTSIVFTQSGTNLSRGSWPNMWPPNDKIIAKNLNNINGFRIVHNPNTGTGNREGDTFTITITLTKEGRSVTFSTTVCPKNYCADGPYSDDFWFGCTPNYNGRSFNRDYQDVVQ